MRHILSLATAFLVAIFGMIAVPVIAQAAESGPSIVVSEAPRAGGTITVTGSGFDTSVPEVGSNVGVYIGIGTSGASSFYTAAATSVIWIAPGNADDPSGTMGATAPMNADGTFSVTLQVPAYAEASSYSVYVAKAHGQHFSDPSQAVIEVINYAAEAPVATTTTTNLTVASTDVVLGDTVELYATVSPAEATGSVQFSSNGAPIEGGLIALVDGVAIANPALPAGPHAITADFIPSDSNYATSTSAVSNITVTAAPEPSAPHVTVMPTTPLDPAVENVITVSGTGFTGPGAVDGVYVLFGEKSVWSGEGPLVNQGWIALDWVRAASVVDGAFTMNLTIPAGTLDPTKEYQVATSATGRLSATDRSIDTFTPVAIQQPVASGPSVTVSPNTPLDPSIENVITVTGTGFTGPGAAGGVYVLFGETSVWAGEGPLVSEGWIALDWVRAASVVDGAFTMNLTIPAGTLDPTKEYQVATSATGRLSATDRSIDTFTAVAVGEGAVVEPGVTASSLTVKQGGQITFTGVGFADGEMVSGVVNSDPVDLGSQAASAQGVVSFDWVVPVDFAPGDHTITLTSASTTVSMTFTVDALVIVSDQGTDNQIGQCVARAVTGGNFSWGLNTSFRNYITGPIANGAFSGGSFTATSGAFNVNDGGVGRANFAGSIVATGHGGLLNLQLSNPSIQITGPGTAVLFAYVSSTDATGAPAVAGTVAFANLSFSGPTISGDTLTVSNATATLTGAGSQAFADFYPAGTALDPVSFTVSLGGNVDCDSSTDPVRLASTGTSTDAGLGMTSVAGLAMLLGFALIRRRRQMA